MMRLRILKLLFLLCFIAAFAASAAAGFNTYREKDGGFEQGLRGKTFMVSFSVGEDEYTDAITFESNGAFTMAFFSEIEDSSGFYLDLLGILFFAHLSGTLMFDPFSFSFFGVHFNPDIFGITIINFGDSQYINSFSGIES